MIPMHSTYFLQGILALLMILGAATDETNNIPAKKSLVGLVPCKQRSKDPVPSNGVCVNRRHCLGKWRSSADCRSPTGRVLVCCSDQVQKYSVQKAKDGECGTRPSSLTRRQLVAEPIVGGSTSSLNSWPWMVAVYFGRHYICGGSLIAGRCILTAAHCFENLTPDPRQFNVRVGEHNLFSDNDNEFPDEYQAEKIVLHPQYRLNHSDHDMALMILPETSSRIPACLPVGYEKDIFFNRTAIVSGWGTRNYDPNFREPATAELQEVVVPVLKTQFCDTNYKLIPDYKRAFQEGLTEDRYICAGYNEGGKDACLGDSGGPLVTELEPGKWGQIGVVTIGFACGQGGFPGIYTRVTAYLPWIQENCFADTPRF